jgi:GntR family transcriptional regulator, transcriptional repressor for pyruvate dehydrogenase complex
VPTGAGTGSSAVPPIDWGRVAVRPNNLPDGLAASLERMIADGTLAAGARIPAERELATRMGVSRASVRSALRDLELKGLIDRRPGRGTVVADHSARLREAGSLLGLLERTDRDLMEAMDLRATIEPPIAARAAVRATAADIRRLHEIIEAAAAAGSLKEFAELDEAFHRQLSRCTHNPLLERLMATSSDWIGPSRSSARLTRGRAASSLAAHREIAEAVAARDPDAAAEAMASHIERVNAVLAVAADLPSVPGALRVKRR